VQGGLRLVAAGEALDQAPGDGRGEQGVAGAHQTQRGHQMLRGDVLEQEAAGARGERGVDVLVEIVGRQDEDAGLARAVGQDPPGGLQPVHPRHPDVHEHRVGPGPPDGGDRLGAIGRLGHHLDAVSGEDHAESGAHQGLVVGDDDPQRAGHADVHGRRALIRYPPPGSGPASRVPP
jgi:hypothetical protein